MTQVTYVGGPHCGQHGEVSDGAVVVRKGVHWAAECAVYHSYRRSSETDESGRTIFTYSSSTSYELPHDSLCKRALCWLGVAEQSVLAIP